MGIFVWFSESVSLVFERILSKETLFLVNSIFPIQACFPFWGLFWGD